DQIQQQLENLQQRLASASGLEDKLEELKEEQRAQQESSQTKEQASSATNKNMTDPGAGGSDQEQGNDETNGPRYRLEGFKMDFTGIGDVDERGDSSFQGSDDLRAWEDEKVPAQYKSVVKRYFESLSSKEK
ncbi:MAG TPA: hypothetical protein PKH07_11565, partial [bacterium]|nr:hypothetical protein [bacterium]